MVSENIISTLHETVEKEQIDLILLSAHGYSGDSKWPYGSVVTSFISYGNTPLLIFQDIPRNLKKDTDAEVGVQESGKQKQ
jgi:nucleotide-binding universal stress UspA family protein